MSGLGLDLLWIAVGAVLLYGGGEALVDGARKLALRLGVEPMVIGLTVVALGTSMPELAATLTAAIDGAPEVAFGNVVGSNIANLGLVLGTGALIYPLTVKARFLVREVPFMVGASVLMLVLSLDGEVGWVEGVLLLLLLLTFLSVQLRSQGSQGSQGSQRGEGSQRESAEVQEEFAREYADDGDRTTAWLIALVVVGIVTLTLGAKALVVGAVGVARSLGVEERVIGLTVVAFGTSLPEMAGTIVAAAKREGDIILGNLIGSNVFNILCILGTTVVIRPLQIDIAAARVDLLVMVGLSFLVWPLMSSGRRLTRVEGGVLVVFYLVYVAWLFWRV